ncbi:sensor histidine kinase [Planosporangium sp. 12N6]|uniref:sensor histidine kinase n=1 Tax=Planosporangium spinosum TaxID=3402278 RepID=UPI003CF85D56
MTAPTPWAAVRDAPLRLAGSAVPWRALAYLATGVPVGVAALVALPLLLPTAVGPAAVGIVVAAIERRRLRLVDPRTAPSPHGRLRRPGPVGWLAARLREPATWQEVAFTVLVAVALWVVDLATVVAAGCLTLLPLSAPLLVAALPAASVPHAVRLRDAGVIWLLPLAGVVTAVAMAYLVTAVAAMRAAVTRALVVAPDGSRLVELASSRARIVQGFDSERRRIERDLHDGLQQRLLALSVNLGLARLAFRSGEGADLDRLLAVAHQESKVALDELRDVVRGIHPWLLTDRGLPAAVADLAARSAVAVSTDIRLDGRLPQSVETTAYYVVAEALTNIDKHSGARQATVAVRSGRRGVTVEIRDDGHGGADPARGTGLQGLADRADAVGARLLVSSPPGGPTVLRLEVPCPPRG